jgi:archaellum component FlaF (FlaF/FlaG flagellin family)
MENSIPALMIAAILMLSTVFIARSGYVGIDAIGQSIKESEARSAEQKRTGLDITATDIDGAGANITLHVENNGQTSIGDYARMDVLVQYFDEEGNRHDKWLPYTDGALAADTWTIGAFTNDIFEPGILNSGEGVEILIRVNPVVGPGTSNRAIIATERAVTVQTYFDGP